ncbi:MAG: hypothetical protein JWN63_2081 [Candidatus Acidoferrum typicum]|nr:hypothetical protein [Candidatus Acidoferrum typicum]
MNQKNMYLFLCVLGAVLPYWQFILWIVEHGPNIGLLIRQLFANRISAFFGLDVCGLGRSPAEVYQGGRQKAWGATLMAANCGCIRNRSVFWLADVSLSSRTRAGRITGSS